MTSANSMQCPSCRSHYTQAVSVAYSQSIRTGYNGHQSISEFGRDLEPPPARSEFAIPFMVAIFVFSVALFTLPSELGWVDMAWLQALFSTFWGRVALSATLAIAALLLMSASAIGYNISVHSDDMSEWEKDVICRRCGHRFSR
jgi:hypothetical protein